MLIRHSRPRGNQPQGGAQIDWAHPIARGLRFVQVGDIAQNMADFALRAGGAGSPTDLVGGLGRARRYQDTAEFYTVPALDAGTEWGMFVLADVALMNTWGGVMAHTSNLGTTQGWAGWQLINDSTWNCYGAAGSPVGGLAISGEIIGQVGIALAATYEAGIGTQMWLNGVRRTAVSGTAGAGAPGVGYLKVASSRDSAAMTGNVYAAYAWDRGISTPEVEALQENPWAFFAPRRRRIYVDIGAGPVLLSVADLVHGHGVDAVMLSQAHALAVAAATHGHGVDAPTLTQVHELAVAAAAHVHGVDTPALTQVHQLALANVMHAHASETFALAQVHELAVADAIHAGTTEAITLAVAGALAVDDATHGHTTQLLSVAQQHALVVAHALHASIVDSVALTAAGQLAVSDALHGHGADAPALTQAHQVEPADALHGHAVDSVALTQAVVLAIQAAIHGHAAQGVTLSADLVLAVQDALHSNGMDAVALGQTHVLVLADALHAHLAATLTLAMPAAAALVGDRFLLIRGESRSLVVVPESRVLQFDADPRVLTIH
ncbi:MAG: hypothetical protein KIT73_04220 [Burkholderiales bacterium]|nr:hypothetical protein [Burkholderiales bacterium]